MKRRFATRYYPHSRAKGPSRWGAASTVQGAVRATVFRVFMRMYGPGTYAVIHDRQTETDLIRVWVGPQGLAVEYLVRF